MECPNCQTANPAEAKFCMACGTLLSHRCPNCNTELPPEASFCFNCGHKIKEPEITTTIQEEAVAPAGPAPSQFQGLIPRELLTKLENARDVGAMEGERRIVTMLFCDVKGSTAAAGQLDPEEWAEVINGAFEHLISPVYQYEGTVARLMGDGILAFFGAPIAHEDDPQRAILAGLEILESIASYRQTVKQRWGLEFDVRVGINTGLVVVGAVGSNLRMEYTALGDAINLAARMEQTAQPGTIQVSEDTYKLVAPLFEFEALGQMEIKGKEKPVSSFQVLGRKAEPGQLRGIEGLESPLVGRDAELHALRGAIIELRQGRGSIVSIIGEAGLGKSRLAAELRESPTPATGSREKLDWLEGRSLSYESSTPYAPFIRIYSDCFALQSEMDDSERYQRIVDGVGQEMPGREDEIAPFIASLLGIHLSGESLERVRYLEPPQLRSRIFQATRDYIERMAASKPLVLAFDDLHWVDSTSLDLLEELMPLTDRTMLMIMVLFRPRRQEPSWRFHETAQRDYSHRYQAVEVTPLDNSSSRELVANLLYVDNLPESVRNLILAKAEGNPFFVEEVIRSMLDAGLIIHDGDHWQATQEIEDITIPDTLSAVLTTRLDRLDDETKQVIQTAAVISREFGFDILADVLGKPVEVERALTDLMRRELIREKSQHPNRIYIFKHNLTQETAYRSLLLRKRRELHGLVGASLEQHDPERVTDIARHFNEAGERERALPYLVEAADRAARAYATAEAIAFYREALEILESVGNPELARRVYEGLGSALTLANEIPDAIGTYNEMLNLAKESDDIPMQVSALNKLSFVSALRLGQFQEAENYLAESDNLARNNEDKAGLSEHNLIRCMMCTAVADFESVEHYMAETIQLGQELGIEEQKAMGLAHIASSQVFMLKFDEARETMQEGLALSRKIGDREHEAEILANTEPLYYWRGGDFEAARTSALEGIEIATKIGAMNLLAPAWRMMGYLDFQQGKYESALQHFERYLEASRQAGIVWFEVEALCLLGSVQLDIDEVHLDDVLALHDQAEQLMEQPGGIIMGASAWIEVGTCALEIGKLEKAAELFQKGLTIPTATMNLERPRLIHGQALLAMENGEVDKAAALLREARAIAEQHAIKPFYPDLELTEGKLQLMNESFAAATESFEHAERLAQEMNLQPLLWKARIEKAKALSALGQTAEAAQAREEARTTIDELARYFTDPELRRNFLSKVTADLVLEPGG